MLLIFAFLFACGHGAADPQPAPDAVPPAPAVVAPAPVTPAAGPPPVVTGTDVMLGEADASGNDTILPGSTTVITNDPAALYGMCRDRVEGDEKPGECKVDADCSRAGCSKEVCVPTAVAADLNTTCDKQPCFDVLESCGCISGTCSWTVRKSL